MIEYLKDLRTVEFKKMSENNFTEVQPFNEKSKQSNIYIIYL